MKKILFVCLVGVALMMGACGEKESSDNGGATTATHDIVYYVDGENQQSTGLSDSQWNILLDGIGKSKPHFAQQPQRLGFDFCRIR